MAHAIGRLSVWAKSSFHVESAIAALPTMVDAAWPLIRDMVLEEAAKVCDRQHDTFTSEEEADAGIWSARICARRIRALKGDSGRQP